LPILPQKSFGFHICIVTRNYPPGRPGSPRGWSPSPPKGRRCIPRFFQIVVVIHASCLGIRFSNKCHWRKPGERKKSQKQFA
jgi:hypothetical protein